MSLEILIGADVAPTASSFGAFQSSESKLLFEGLEEIWRAADARIVNLQTPLANGAAPLSCAEGLSALNTTGVCICNEHILDAGAEGIASTRAALKGKHIAPFGAGEDLEEADQPYYYVKHGVRIGFYAVSEHALSFATDRSAGANPIDLIGLSDRVRGIKADCDRLVVLYCGGRDGYPYPSPDVQKICRKIAECGASLVICQQGCCAGSAERWNNATIVYGQGAFLAGGEDAKKGRDTGLLVRYQIGDYGADKVDYVPFVRTDGGAALALADKAAEILEGFQKRSLRIRVEGFVSARFAAYAAEQKEKLFGVFLGGNVLLRTLNMLSGRRPTRVYDGRTKKRILGALIRESDRELMIAGLMRDDSFARN